MVVEIELKKDIKVLKDELTRQNKYWGVAANHSIFRASTTILTYINKKLYKYGVTQRSTAILNLLVEHGGEIAQKRLTKSLDLTKQAAASALMNLEKQHLIIKIPGNRDGRSNIIQITEEGLKIEKECLPIREANYNIFMASMTESEARHMVDTLTRLSDKLIADMKKKLDRV